jgi:predicted DNA-binding protein
MKKYNWIGNQVQKDDMTKLYHLSKKTGKPITILVKEAVQEYLAKN